MPKASWRGLNAQTPDRQGLSLADTKKATTLDVGGINDGSKDSTNDNNRGKDRHENSSQDTHDENTDEVVHKCKYCTFSTKHAWSISIHKKGCRYDPSIPKCVHCGTKVFAADRLAHEEVCSKNPEINLKIKPPKNRRLATSVERDDEVRPKNKTRISPPTYNEPGENFETREMALERHALENIPWMSLRDILRTAKYVTSKDGVSAYQQRLSAAPYAYNKQGRCLLTQYWHFLEIKDEHGMPLLTESEIGSVTKGIKAYRAWKLTAAMCQVQDLQKFAPMVLATLPEYRFPTEYFQKGQWLPGQKPKGAAAPHSESLLQKPLLMSNRLKEIKRIMSTLVECEFCEQKIPPAEIKAHEDQCFPGLCPGMSTCLYCGKKQWTDDWQTHQESCLENPVNFSTCSYCSRSISSNEFQFHEDTCWDNPRRGQVAQCKYCCQPQLGGALEDHEEACSHNISNFVDCSYCHLKLPVGEKQSHEKLCPNRILDYDSTTSSDDDDMSTLEWQFDDHSIGVTVAQPQPLKYPEGALEGLGSNSLKSSHKVSSHKEPANYRSRLAVKSSWKPISIRSNLKKPAIFEKDGAKDQNIAAVPQQLSGAEIVLLLGESQDWTYQNLKVFSKDQLCQALTFLGLECSGSRHELTLRLVAKSKPIIIQCEEAGIELSRVERESYDIYPEEERVINILALHLVCTYEFHELMGGTVLDPQCIKLDKDWLSNVQLPGRCSRWKSFKSWMGSFSKKLQMAVIAEAEAMYRDFPPELKILGVRYVFSFPPSSDFSTPLRDDIFRYHEMRHRLLDTIKHCTTQQFGIKNSRHPSFFEHESPDQQHVLLKLLLLQQAEVECRQQLSSTTLEPAFLHHLDILISRTGMLDRNPESLSLISETVSKTIQAAIASISEKHAFRPNYYLEEIFCSPIHKATPMRFKIKEPSTPRSEPVISTLFSHGSLHEHAHRLGCSLQSLFDGIDFQGFQTNMQYFAGIDERLPKLTSGEYPSRRKNHPGRRAKFFQSEDLLPSDLLHDNVYHTRSLLETIFIENNTMSDAAAAEARKTWLRMLGVLSITYGLTDEPSRLLSITERLLQDLMACFMINDSLLNPDKASLVTVTKIVSSSTQGPLLQLTTGKPSGLSTAQEHRNHLLIAELARFFRGSIISAFTITAAPAAIPTRIQGTITSSRHLMYKSLLHYTRRCGSPGCSALLAPPGELDQRRHISIGVRDSRVGGTHERADISEDRLEIYDCPSTVKVWNSAAAPFFLYFSKMFHLHCKA